MKNRSALITGGAKRLGQAIALSLAEKGYHIALHCHHSKNEAEKTAKKIKQHGVKCHIYLADLNQNDDMLSLIPNVLQDLPDLCLLINNASIFERGHLMDTDIDLFDRTWNINLKVPFFLSRDFADYRAKGHIINMLDTKISKPLLSYFIYSLSKITLSEFTKMAARELGPNIRVNGICPGLILPSKDTAQEAFVSMGSKIPLKGTGDPSRIVSAVHYLIENTFVTGETLFVDGGEHLM